MRLFAFIFAVIAARGVEPSSLAHFLIELVFMRWSRILDTAGMSADRPLTSNTTH